MTIWLFYNRQGEWGLRLNGRYTTCRRVDVQIPMRGVFRPGASPNAYLLGHGQIEWHANGTIAVLRPLKK